MRLKWIIIALVVLVFFFSTETGSKIMTDIKNKLTRGLRNNNPGNMDRPSKMVDGKFVYINVGDPGYVAYQGEVRSSDSRFRQFQSMEYGYRAMFKLIQTYRTKYGLDSVQEIINRWAPPIENNTSAYVNAVAKAVGVTIDQSLLFTKDEYLKLVGAISRHENGIEPDYDQVNQGYELFQS
jgi:hypothetical protein